MSAYKDKTQGTWYVSFRYIDWTGKKTQKLKRGFKTKKEALNYEKEFIRKTAADMKMEMNSFIQVYFEDKKNELKENSIRNKQHMMNKHIVPYFGTRKMNEITPAEIIQWQNTIQEKGYRVHDIRHSHVAYLIYQGVEPLIIKERLGHKDIQMTLNTYGHLYPSQQKKVAEMLDNKR